MLNKPEVTDKLSPVVRGQLEGAINSGKLTNFNIPGIISSLARQAEKNDRRQKKKATNGQKNGSQAKIEIKPNKIINYSSDEHLLISHAASLQIWGPELVPLKSKDRPELLFDPNLPGAGLLKPDFNPQVVWLNGFPVKTMAEKFPDHDWLNYKKLSQGARPQYYLVSFENQLVSLSVKRERELWPDGCWRLDFNLTAELLLTLHYLGKNVPPIFFRTGQAAGHGDEACVALKNGQLHFALALKIKGKADLGLALVREYSLD